MAAENNEVRILGIRPAHNTDDFPVSQADKDLLKMTIHLMAYHQPTTTWKKVLCDLNGKLIVDPTAILENPPVEDNAGKAATSEWCYDHWKDANAHHAKYTDAEARALLSPISVPPASFHPYLDTNDWSISQHTLQNRAALTLQYYVSPILFPPGVTITKLTLYGYVDDALAFMRLYLFRVHRLGGAVVMADVLSNWTIGWSSLYNDSINYALINNGIYSYSLLLYLDPNDSVNDVKFSGAKIEFTG